MHASPCCSIVRFHVPAAIGTTSTMATHTYMAKKTRKARAARVNYDERRSAHDGDETNSDEKTPANFAETAVFAISLSFFGPNQVPFGPQGWPISVARN